MSNHPKLHSDWIQLRESLKNKPWQDQLLTGLKGFLGFWKWDKWASRVGSSLNQIEIDSRKPIESFFSFDPLRHLFVKYNVFEPNTKNPGTRTVFYTGDTGVLMVLVKVPDGESFKWYLLARRKDQFAAKDLFFEFFRGYLDGSTAEDRGWRIFERDLSGLKDNPLVASIYEQKMVNPVFEDNAFRVNKITRHLIVVTLNQAVGKDELQSMLVEARLKVEYPDESDIDSKYLTSYPLVMELDEAAKILNSYSELREENLAFFGENFSVTSWAMFLSRWGWQFPHLMPEKGKAL